MKLVLRAGVMWLAVCVMAWTLPADKPAETLYFELSNVELDATRVYQVRGASLNRSAIQISLEDGTIAFTRDVMGRVTGAFFEGDGEILLTPPNAVERQSMSLFTGMAILEERFATAYFRFEDDVTPELMPDLRETTNKQEFVNRWNATAKNLANADATRLLMTFSEMLTPGTVQSSGQRGVQEANRFLHARLQGIRLGVFDVYFDTSALEAIQAGQAKNAENGQTFYDVWTSFSLPGAKAAPKTVDEEPQAQSERIRGSQIAVRRYRISTEVEPPKQIRARARVECEARASRTRTLLFELSRFLQIKNVTMDGQPVEFIHNPALEGTQLSRRGNDIVAVVLPEPLRAGQKFNLEFEYAGEVLAEAGSGLVYVGARGTWYPNRGMEMADYDLEFRYPPGWKLVATGKPEIGASQAEGQAETGGEQSSHWVSERPIPIAGFNLGKYREATTQAGTVKVETFATVGVEKDFPNPPIQVIEQSPADPLNRRTQVVAPARPSPASREGAVGETAAHAIEYFSERIGRFPYGRLALTQMPGRESQGWPGLVFLSSYAFLSQEERQSLHYGPAQILLQEYVPVHETAHQWWGDLITWNSYRDQWFSEGLANYCSLMMLQQKNPAGFREVMNEYRRDLTLKNKDGMAPMEAGPVTLGTRLLSSHFPEGYEAISYGRATWLFHMLRTMLDDASEGKQQAGTSEEPFVRALRKIRERYEGKSMSTRQMLAVFAEDLPAALRYERKNSLDWFFEGWISGTAVPKLELRGVKIVPNPKGSGQIASGTILQKEAPEELITSVPLYAVVTGKQPILLGRIFADGAETGFRLPAPAGTHKILLDPYETVLSQSK